MATTPGRRFRWPKIKIGKINLIFYLFIAFFVATATNMLWAGMTERFWEIFWTAMLGGLPIYAIVWGFLKLVEFVGDVRAYKKKPPTPPTPPTP